MSQEGTPSPERSIVEQPAQSLAVFCPGHQGPDHIRQVSVVYADAAPERLSPVPVLRSADRLAWAGTICGLAGAALLVIGTAVRGAVSGTMLGVAGVCIAYAIACYGLAAARRASVVRVRRGMPRALAVWQAAWYCDQCDGVFFASSMAPAGAASGTMMSTGEFQRLVWSAGGYGAASAHG
jgi:hypothetical protein